MTTPTAAAPASIIDALTQGLAHALTGLPALIETNPVPAAVAAVLVLAVVISKASQLRPTPKDPSRLFSATQRSEGFARAGGRCELEGFLFLRCRRKAHHGDHYLPWSKGGSTSMRNFVAACARCNTSKGAKTPSFLAIQRLEMRRRRYFPAGLDIKAGERFTHP